MNLADLDALYAAIGEGQVSAQSIVQRLARELAAAARRRAAAHHGARRARAGAAPGRRTGAGVYVEGLDDVMVHLARCCTPVPGDQIIGFVTQGRGVSVHRADCANATALADGAQERLIEVEWDRGSDGVFVATIEVLAFDRSRLLADVSRVVSEHHLNIVAARTATDARPGQPDALRRRAGRPGSSGVAAQLAQAPRRRLRRLPPAPRQEGLSASELVTDESRAGAAARPDGDPRRPVARVGPLGAPAWRASPPWPSGPATGWSITPDVRGRRGLPPRHRRGAATSWARRCTSSTTGTARLLALRPEGTASVVRAFVAAPPGPALEGLVRDARLPLRAAPGRAATASTTSSASRRSGRRPRPRRRGDRAGRRLLSPASGCARSPSSCNSMGDGDCRPAYLDLLRRVPGASARPALRRAPQAAPRATRCGCSTARRPSAGRPPRTRRASSTTSATPCAAALRPGARRASTRSGSPTRVDHRLVRGLDYYTRTTFEFAAGRLEAAQNAHRRRRPLRRPGRGARAARRRRASASASASSGCSSPATPRASSPADAARPLDAFVVDVTGGRGGA